MKVSGFSLKTARYAGYKGKTMILLVFMISGASAGLAGVGEITGKKLVTLEMKVNFIRPVSSGFVIAETSPLHKGRKTSVWEIKVNDEEDRTVAFATATYMVASTPAQKNIFPVFE